jgi:dipeptidyl aminopeptidase/acylaminoacyl peptidase
MDSNEAQNLAEPTPKKQNAAKAWLWLLPVLAICTLSFCGVAAGLFFWQIRSNQTEESGKPVSVLTPQNQTGNSLTASTTPTATPIALTPLSNQANPIPTFVCPDDNLSANQAVTAPLMSPVSFATRQGVDSWPLDSSLQFTTAVTTVLATFSYNGLENGLTWERVWSFGDKELSRGSGVWDAGPRGRLTVQVKAGEGGFAPGVYKLEIYVQDQLLSQGIFNMVAADTPTQRPVQVAYTTWNGQAHQLNLLDLTTSQTETLMTAARGPAWSADAIGLLFYSESSAAGNAGLQVFNMGQRKAYPLTQETFQTIAWSPHRTYVASTAGEGQESHLVLWDLDQNKVYPGPFGADPTWSPEGQRLAYRGCTGEGWNISTLEVIGPVFDTASTRRLTQGDDSQPAWSRDGQHLAFVRRDGDNQDIYVVAADGSNLTRLTDHPAADVAPAWTPDNRLLFRSLRDGQWAIYAMNMDGSNQSRLVTTPSEAGWQPDRLAVSTNVLVVTPEPPKPQPQIPAGHGLLAISNQKNNDEMTFTIDNKEHKIRPYQLWMLPLRPGHYTWTASWPGKNSRTGIADITLGQVAYPVVER